MTSPSHSGEGVPIAIGRGGEAGSHTRPLRGEPAHEQSPIQPKIIEIPIKFHSC